MKAVVFISLFCLLSLSLHASSPYRNYLLTKVYIFTNPVTYPAVISNPSISASAYIPRFERPKGAIFCRMEDKVTKATKVWLKLGVQ